MSAKWRKIIWALLAVQLYFLHFYLISQLGRLSYYVSKVVGHFDLPYVLYSRYPYLIVGGWLLVAVGILSFHGMQYLRFRTVCYQGLELVENEKVRELFEEVSAQMGKKGIALQPYCSDKVSAPFIMGFHSFTLLIPRKSYDLEALRMIFLHECRHMAVKDIWYKIFLLITQSLLWYQPLSYVLRYLGYIDVEIACDEAVVKGQSLETRTQYGQTLIDNLHNRSGKGLAYSTFFNNGKQVMKARIHAVMDKERRFDWLAILAIVLLVAETLFAGFAVTNWIVEYRKVHMEKLNLYDGYELPESDILTVVNQMLSLNPLDEDGYYHTFLDENQNPLPEQFTDMEYSDMTNQAQGPWQIRLKNPDRYMDSIYALLPRYFYYFENQEAGSEFNIETGSYLNLEILYSRALAGNAYDFACYVIVREYAGQKGDDLTAFTERGEELLYENGCYYAYSCLALHIRMVEDYVFELCGVVDGEKVLEAFQNTYPEMDYDKTPRMELLQNTDSYMYYHKNEDELQVCLDGENLVTVPVPMSDILDRGDQMDGALNNVQEDSYQLDEIKQIFAYGSGQVPVSVMYYDWDTGEWRTSVVTTEYHSARRLFVGFPEDSLKGYLVLTSDRTMWQEASLLFTTEDGGVTWKEVGYAGPDPNVNGHSLTTGAVFMTNKIGYVTIYDSESPDIWQTFDGGATWSRLELDEVPEYYTMAYPPEITQNQKDWKLYLSMEEYSRYSGTKAVYESKDQGETWSFQGYVIRK